MLGLSKNFNSPSGKPLCAWPESACLALWCGLAVYAVCLHVPWADESQAWMLAQENSWGALFVHALHYEGTGGLWHAALKLLAGAHVSFTGARCFAAAAQAAAIAVLLRYAPFPRLLRLLLPFTFFLFFQDGVIARSYCFFAVLAFSAAVIIRGQTKRPKILGVLTGLLANLSVHGVLLGAGLLAVGMAYGRTGRNQPQEEKAKPSPAVPKMGKAAANRGLGALWPAAPLFLFAAWTMAPAPDIDFQAGGNLHNSLVKIARPLGIHLKPVPSVAALSYAGLEPAPVPVHTRRGAQSLINRVERMLGVLTFPLSRSRVLALLAAAAVTAQAVSAGRAPGLLPWAGMALVFTSLYLAPRHAGTLFTAFLVTAWLTWPAPEQLAVNRRLLRINRAAVVLLTLIAVEQIGWTARALLSERRSPYAPARMTARFLQAAGVGQGATAAGYLYFSSAPLLYFSRNIYLNQPPHRYWLWSTSVRGYQSVWQTLALHPALIVVSTVQAGPDAEITADWLAPNPTVPGVVRGDQFRFIPFFEAHGYREARVFCGRSLMRGTYAELLCDTVLESR